MSRKGGSSSGRTADEGGEIHLTHPVWTGSISLGLVRVPVKMITITRDRRIHFRKIHRACNTPISYRQVCEEGEIVPNEEIVYGYEVAKDTYVTLEKEEIMDARPETSETIKLDAFISEDEVDPHFFRRTYLLVPDKAEDAYSLLLTVMEKTGRAAVGKVSMFSREYVVLVHPYEGTLVATILRFHDEILSPRLAPTLQDLPRPSAKELEIATGIVEKMTAPFDLASFEDAYRQRLEELISAKIEGRTAKLEKRVRTAHVKELLEALKQTAEAMEH